MAPGFENFLSALLDENILNLPDKNLVQMSAFGLGGENSWALFKSFQELGILHLLILSGSQINQLGKVILLFFSQFFSTPTKKKKIILGFALSFLISYYLYITHFPPSLVRAALCFLLLYFFNRRPPAMLLLLALILQVSFFPEHLSEIGFYLSWMSFLILIAVNHFQWNSLWQTLILCLSCQLILYFVLGVHYGTWRNLLVYFLANVILCYLFERIFFKILAIWIFSALCLSLISVDINSYLVRIFSFSLSAIFFPIVRLILVVVEGIRYTLN